VIMDSDLMRNAACYYVEGEGICMSSLSMPNKVYYGIVVAGIVAADQLNAHNVFVTDADLPRDNHSSLSMSSIRRPLSLSIIPSLVD